jgi:hypothetical protein
MQFTCRFHQLPSGAWTAEHASSDLGHVRVAADTREAVAKKLQDELRYRLEICPCTGELYDSVNIELVEET